MSAFTGPTGPSVSPPPPTTSMVMLHEAVKGLGQMQIPLFSDTASHGEGLRGRAGARQACHVGTQGEYHLAAKQLGGWERGTQKQKKNNNRNLKWRKQTLRICWLSLIELLLTGHVQILYRTLYGSLLSQTKCYSTPLYRPVSAKPFKTSRTPQPDDTEPS